MLDNFSNTAGIPVINDISEKSPQEQLYEMHNYLYQLQEWLDWKLRHLEAEDFTDDTMKKIGTAEDTGWKKITVFSGPFTRYSTIEQIPMFRKIGNVVYLRGAVKPTEAIAGSATEYNIFTLPRGFRPNDLCCFACHGSGAASWLLTIRKTGEALFSRYADANGYASAGTSTWLPFCVSFPAG